MDILEANNRAFQVTPHKCGGTPGSYYSCDGSGCGQNSYWGNALNYGPGSKYIVNTERPFQVSTKFTADGDALTEITTEVSGPYPILDTKQIFFPSTTIITTTSTPICDSFNITINFLFLCSDFPRWSGIHPRAQRRQVRSGVPVPDDRAPQGHDPLHELLGGRGLDHVVAGHPSVRLGHQL